MNYLAVGLLVLTSVFSAAFSRDTVGLFGCPVPISPSDNVATDDIVAFKAKFFDTYLPMKLYAAADVDISRPFSCITFSKSLIPDQVDVSYYEDGVASPLPFPSLGTVWTDKMISITLVLPKKGLLGANNVLSTMIFYLKDDLNDFVTFQSCEPRFLSYSLRTYSFLKATADAADYEWRCVVEAVDSLYGVGSEPKGIC